MRKMLTVLVLTLLALPLFAQSSIRETRTERLSLFGSTTAPPSCRTGVLTIYWNTSTGLQKSTNCTTWTTMSAGAIWGSITGTLSGQTDLQSALNLKAPLISPSFTTPTLGVASATSLQVTTITQGSGITSTVGAGAPSGACVTGSMYRRSDGGTSTTLYICESTAWVAK